MRILLSCFLVATAFACGGEPYSAPVDDGSWEGQVDDAFLRRDAVALAQLRDGDGPRGDFDDVDAPVIRTFDDCPLGLELTQERQAVLDDIKADLSQVFVILDEGFEPDPIDFCFFWAHRFRTGILSHSNEVSEFLQQPEAGLPFPVRFYVSETAPAPDKPVEYFDSLAHKIRIGMDFEVSDVPAFVEELKRVTKRRFPNLQLVAVPENLTLPGADTLEARYGKTVKKVALDATLAETLEDVRYFVVPDISGDFPAAARPHINAFVKSGGRLIHLFSSNDATARNSTFQLGLQFNQGSFSQAARAAELTGGAAFFAAGPADLNEFNDFDATVTSSLPANAQVVYSFNQNDAGVVYIPIRNDEDTAGGDIIIIGEIQALQTDDKNWVQLMKLVLDIPL